MRIWLFATTVVLFGGALAAVACSDHAIVDGRSANPNFERPDSGGGTSGTSGTSGQPKDLTSVPGSGLAWCDGVFGARADKFESCCTAADKATFEYQLYGGTFVKLRDECRVRVEQSVTKGRVHVDTANLAACKSFFSSWSCGKLVDLAYKSPVDVSCIATVFGKQTVGMPCALPLECAGGTTCVGYTSTTEGTCKTIPTAGQACGPLMVDGGGSALGFATAATSECSVDSNCVKGVCVARGQSGADCLNSSDCASTLNCLLGKCSTTAPGGLGATCARELDCVLGLYCTNTNKCATRKSAGDACSVTNFGAECLGNCQGDAGAQDSGSCTSFCGSP